MLIMIRTKIPSAQMTREQNSRNAKLSRRSTGTNLKATFKQLMRVLLNVMKAARLESQIPRPSNNVEESDTADKDEPPVKEEEYLLVEHLKAAF
jgi:hypothetical protein